MGTHEVDSVIDKMNMLNEMFERILKHMDKVIPVHGHDEKDSSGKDETKPKGDDDDEKKEEKTEGDDEESTDDEDDEGEEEDDEDYSEKGKKGKKKRHKEKWKEGQEKIKLIS